MMANALAVTDNQSPMHEDVLALPTTKARSEWYSRLPREGIFWLLATLLLFVTGLFKGINLLVLLGYLLAGLWLLNLWLLRVNMRRLRGRRIPPGPIFAGEPVDCSIEISCTGVRPVRGIVLVVRGDNHNRKWLVLSLSPNSPLRIRYCESFPKRGRYLIPGLRAVSSFPFGLTARRIELSGQEDWIVLPRLGHVDVDQMRNWLARILRGDGRTRRRRLVPTAMEADIHGLRDFRPGDSPRWIHWRTSARRNQLLVREFEDSSQPQIALVVEPWLPAKPDAEDLERLETLISLTSTVIRDWCRHSSARLTLILVGDAPTILETGSGSEFALHMLSILAVENGRSQAEDLSWLDRANRGVRAAMIMALSSKLDSSLSHALRCELGRPVAEVDMGELPAWYESPLKLSAG